HARRSDLDEFCLGTHLLDGGATAVAHRSTHPTHQLVNDGDDAALVRHAAFNTFRHEFVDVIVRILEITVRRTVGHGAYTAHTPVRLVRAPLVQDDLAWRFFGSGEHAAHHAAGRTRGERLGNVTRITDAAIRDERNAGAIERFSHIGNRS